MLIAATVLSMSFVLNAQSDRKVGFRVQAGLNGSKITQFADGTLLPGFRAGVAVDLPIQDVLSIRPTLLFQSKGEAIPLTAGKADVRPMYVEMPILLNVNMGGAENLNFYVNAGPYIAYAVSGQVVGRSKSVLFEGKQGVSVSQDLFKGMEGVDKDGQKQENLTPMNRLDAGLNVNFGVECGKYFFVEVGAEYGLLNSTNHVELSYWKKHTPEYRASHNASAHLSLGVKF